MLDQIWVSRASFQYGLCVALFVVALIKGAMPEKLLSGALVGAIVADLLYHAVIGSTSYANLELGHATQDIVLFAISWAIALRANRVYPLWIAGAQLISVTSHVYRAAFEHIHPVVYAVMMRLPFYVNVLALLLGLTAHIRRTARIGKYPSWRGYSDRFWAPPPRPRPSG
ncbi:hypothetical protein [Novosphingobium colocasiae]|uniref:Uncharacterized protein n=1 Tax=Novosphingobium colocasiae TaxID=1256513 RepID=A0A918PHJ5_9SPHN|nr:hypothetical protein [Novosphingobium colocasiae]GGZ09062.1 hypothetical protein GCM10011614_25000 [Novosphingobium colocasiae]